MSTVATEGKDAAQFYVLPFGKYEGHKLADVPDGYLHWLAGNAKSPSLRAEASRLLDIDQPEDDIDPSPDLAAVVLPSVVFEWSEYMLAEFGDDPVALEIVARGLDKLKQLCSRFTRRPWIDGGMA